MLSTAVNSSGMSSALPAAMLPHMFTVKLAMPLAHLNSETAPHDQSAFVGAVSLCVLRVRAAAETQDGN
jgi:hypothetical protein